MSTSEPAPPIPPAQPHFHRVIGEAERRTCESGDGQEADARCSIYGDRCAVCFIRLHEAEYVAADASAQTMAEAMERERRDPPDEDYQQGAS